MTDEGGNRYVVPGVAHILETRNSPDVDDDCGGEEPCLHQRDEAHPSGHHLEPSPKAPNASSSEEGATYSNCRGTCQTLASCIACHTRFGLTGMSMCFTPIGVRRPPPR